MEGGTEMPRSRKRKKALLETKKVYVSQATKNFCALKILRNANEIYIFGLLNYHFSVIE